MQFALRGTADSAVGGIRRGGRVVGVDLSEKLIDKARAIDANERLGISYLKADAASADKILAWLNE